MSRRTTAVALLRNTPQDRLGQEKNQMGLPASPAAIAKKNAGKQIIYSEGVGKAEPREVLIINQTNEQMERISTILTNEYQGEPLAIEMKYCFKETIQNLIDEFEGTPWKVSKELRTQIDDKGFAVTQKDGRESKVWWLKFEDGEAGETEFS